jgi:peptidoglycan/xylan/chitin deacetylase (PgdA/CDA1 family)
VGELKSAVTVAQSLAWRLRTGGVPTGDGIRILFYHRVSNDHDPLAITPERFRRQMAYLAEAGYRVVDVVDAIEAIDRPQGAKVVGLSFDDGYRDIAEHALPALEEHGFRGTVFVATSVTGGTARFEWYDEQPALLTWDEVVALDRAGTLRFEAHTRTHPNLLAIDDVAARKEIVGGKADLEERIGRAAKVFCYPAGLYRRSHRDMVAAAGFEAAVTCERGANRPDTDRFALRRIGVDGRDRMLDFKAKLGGGHDSPLPLQRAYRRLRYGTEAAAPLTLSS